MTETPPDLRSQLETRKRRIYRMLNTRTVSQDVRNRGTRYHVQVVEALEAAELDEVAARALVAAVDEAIKNGALG